VCHEWKTKWSDNSINTTETDLLNIVNSIKDKNQKYDSIIGLSGGKDSVYALYLLKRVYQCNPLAVNINNGFQSDYVQKYIKRITD